jgi:ribonuclease E
MANKMLIDSSHPEETRVVVLRGNRVEEFDFEAADKRPLRGNIYLAKVTRVEPSLQAAFVDYGGNRHGFLAFSEIHPDYYQIPVADRQALLDEEAEAHRDEEEDEGRPRRSRRHRGERNGHRSSRRRGHGDETIAEEATTEGEDHSAAAGETEAAEATSPELPHEMVADDHAAPTDESEAADASPAAHVTPETFADEAAAEAEPGAESGVVAEAEADAHHAEDVHGEQAEDEPEPVEQLGGDAMEEVPRRAYRARKQYKIQEVIKRRQVLLVQVVKEERGNKGAALTTYLSLAGRYSVLMPNTARGGGISRKITDSGDRQRLKSIAEELEVPEGMGVILRTAGASRTKPEVKRDFEYLLRMWETVRETTLKSTAPTLVYEEGSLIKRAIRDLYNKDIDEILVAGETGYREAKEFMRLLMPSHVRNVVFHGDPQPLFAKAGAEAQLDAMFSNQVTMRSGGYIVINQTEALVAIDVNSGRSTREHDIEDTALRTNLEAADEVARQLRLRDLAGLIVVDFIDMEENRNNRAVERRLKEALRDDRARIQIGRISHFGLLEMSRQRMRTGVVEGSTVICPHCAGAGAVRSTASIALHILRVLEDALIKSASHDLIVRTRSAVAIYILNQKRGHLRDLEARFGVTVTVQPDDSLTGTTYHALERGEPAAGIVAPRAALSLSSAFEEEEDTETDATDETAEDDETFEASAGARAGEEGEGDETRRRRRRRRRRGRGADRETSGIAPNAPQPSDEALSAMGEFPVADTHEADGDEAEGEDADTPDGAAGELPRARRRRSRRGRGRGSRDRFGETDRPTAGDPAPGFMTDDDAPHAADAEYEPEPEPAPLAAEAPPPPAPVVPVEPAAPVAAAPSKAPKAEEKAVEAKAAETKADDPARPKRSGWWQRAKETLGG